MVNSVLSEQAGSDCTPVECVWVFRQLCTSAQETVASAVILSRLLKRTRRTCCCRVIAAQVAGPHHRTRQAPASCLHRPLAHDVHCHRCASLRVSGWARMVANPPAQYQRCSPRSHPLPAASLPHLPCLPGLAARLCSPENTAASTRCWHLAAQLLRSYSSACVLLSELVVLCLYRIYDCTLTPQSHLSVHKYH